MRRRASGVTVKKYNGMGKLLKSHDSDGFEKSSRYGLRIWIFPPLQAYAQDGFAVVEILLDSGRKRIDFVDDFGY